MQFCIRDHNHLLCAMLKSHLITAEALATLCDGAAILEQDGRGVKVYRLPNGDIFKIFRMRSRFSAARIYSYARRFCRNAERLDKLGVPSVEVVSLFHFSDTDDTAVLYHPLRGKTLREILLERALTSDEAVRLGVFFARLHKHGIHFRSLHPGNILLTPQNSFGLIDIADMKIYPWPLWCNTRMRSFTHLHRYPEWIRKIGQARWHDIETGYFRSAELHFVCRYFLQRHLRRILSASLN